MSSKLGVILSMVFVVLFFLFGTDLLCLQQHYSELDSKGVMVAYHIAKNSRIDSDFVASLSNRYKVEILLDPNQSVNYGDVVKFVVKANFNPLIISNSEMVVAVSREAVIGYYG